MSTFSRYWRIKNAELDFIHKLGFVFLSLSFSLCVCVYYELCKVPSSYRQLDGKDGRGQLLSRRYCKHSGRFLWCATRTAWLSQGALAVSCKYFKQSKWPFMAACQHAYKNLSNLRSTRYSSMWRWPFSAAKEAVWKSQGALPSSCKYLRHSRWPPRAANAHAYVLIGHSFATQYFIISRLPCSAAVLIVFSSHLHFFSSRIHLSNSSLFVPATFQQKGGSSHQLGHNDLCSHTNSSVDTDDISFTLNLPFNSFSRDDLLINFLVSLFTSYKNFTSVAFSLGMICLKQISSHFTIKSHTSLSPILLFCARVLAPEDMMTRKTSSPLLFFLFANARYDDITKKKEICAMRLFFSEM